MLHFSLLFLSVWSGAYCICWSEISAVSQSPGIENANCLLLVQITNLNQIQTAHLSLSLMNHSCCWATGGHTLHWKRIWNRRVNISSCHLLDFWWIGIRGLERFGFWCRIMVVLVSRSFNLTKKETIWLTWITNHSKLSYWAYFWVKQEIH